MYIPLRSSIVLLLFACTAALAAPATGQGMKVDLVGGLKWQDHHFAMTNWFYKYKWSEPATQIDILAECGYDGVMLSLKDDPKRWKMLPAYLEAMKKHKVRLAAIHARFYIEVGTYQGPLGTMGYTQGGDIPGKLERARQAWGKIKAAAKQPRNGWRAIR